MIDGIVMFASELLGNLSSAEWLADELLSWLIFTFVVTYAVYRYEKWREARDNEPYLRWTLLVKGYGDPANDYAEAPQQLYLEDVRRFRLSDFELWKFIKSVVSGTLIVKLRTVEKARGVWVFVDEQARRITVDFQKIPDAHVARWDAEKPLSREEMKS
ncbi:MAG: hypothetical protein ACOY2B_05255 [Pseudomonadota bacterium]